MAELSYLELISAEVETATYLSDINTHEMLYINRHCLELMGKSEFEDYQGRKCYEVLHGLAAPCSFCTNDWLLKEGACSWERYDQLSERYFVIRDKLIRSGDGRNLRLEVAYDITEHERQKARLNSRLRSEETLVKCIQTLAEIQDTQTAINQLLSIIGRFYGGRRTYIFEFDFERDVVVNTYEWCGEGVSPEIQNLQAVPAAAVAGWVKQFEKHGILHLNSVSSDLDRESDAYKILEAQGIERLIAVPLIEDSRITGFIGVDDPSVCLEDRDLLTSVTYFVVNDIQKRKMTMQLKRMSYIDLLTGLYNRNRYIAFLQELEKEPPRTFGIVYMDLNGLKIMNDTYGHQYGDHLIVQAAQMLCQVFPQEAFRVGGDEFVAVCRNVERDVFEERVGLLRRLADQKPDLSVSIGAVWDRDIQDINSHISHADDLMYLEKRSYYKNIMHGEYDRRSDLVKQLMRDLEAGLFVVRFQPKFDLETNRVTGAEALVRRKDADGELILPGKFLPLYEAEGAVCHVDFFVLETVCATLERWRSAGLPALKIAVNLSPVTLLEPDVEEELLEVCQRHGVAPENICIGITARTAKIRMEALAKLTKRLLLAGFSIALDDCGSRYSNMDILSDIDFDELKLDKGLISELMEKERSQIIVDNTIRMRGEICGMDSAAEGMEAKARLAALKEARCRQVQGSLCSQGLPAEEFEERFLKQ